MENKYPIYVISKGRYDKPWTCLVLEKMNTPYSVVIEPQEYDDYAKVIPKDKILVLPFSNLGKGSIPARNWVWEHSMSIGAKKHWIMDDNIDGFVRFNRNRKVFVTSSTIFRCMEDFCDRYENIALAGPQYRSFCVATEKYDPYIINARIYSCLLIKNDVEHKWRGRYNEDTDLSLRLLKDGYCTVLFNAFLQGKITTMKVKGGNTAQLYKQDEEFDGRLEMAKSLHEQHPDVSSIVWKFGRWHHHVDYSKFKSNELKLKSDIVIPEDTVDNYGMKMIEVEKTRGFI